MAIDIARNLTASGLFDLLWGTLAEVLGTAATAVLLRRALKRATSRQPSLDELVIRRETTGYTYVVPGAWREPGSGAPDAALRALVGELRPLLLELTGSVVLQRLERVPALRELGQTAPSNEEVT
jgi:hypothetical protein